MQQDVAYGDTGTAQDPAIAAAQLEARTKGLPEAKAGGTAEPSNLAE
jgi:hypothetical protein